MAIDFPNSPAIGDTYTVGNKTWLWDGSTWTIASQMTFIGVNIDGGTPSSNYGGGSLIDGGAVN